MNEGEKGSDATKQELSRMDPYFILFFIFLYESLVLNFTLATLLRNPFVNQYQRKFSFSKFVLMALFYFS